MSQLRADCAEHKTQWTGAAKRSAAFLLMVLLTGCTGIRSTRPRIYDTKADGEQQVAAALQVARAENKHVLLNLGANWCGDSQGMYRLLSTNAEIQRVLTQDYVLAMVDVNKRGLKDRNQALVTKLGNPIKRIPVLLVLDSNGTVLNTNAQERLADSDHRHPDRVLNYLRQWATGAK